MKKYNQLEEFAFHNSTTLLPIIPGLKYRMNTTHTSRVRRESKSNVYGEKELVEHIYFIKLTSYDSRVEVECALTTHRWRQSTELTVRIRRLTESNLSNLLAVIPMLRIGCTYMETHRSRQHVDTNLENIKLAIHETYSLSFHGWESAHKNTHEGGDKRVSWTLQQKDIVFLFMAETYFLFYWCIIQVHINKKQS